MTGLAIAIIAGSTRPGRHAGAVSEWILGQAKGRPGVRYDIVDLIDRPLPLFDEAMPPSFGQYQNEHTKAWATPIAPYDGFVFVSPEYNHSTSAVLKNALDYLHAEWQNKAAARLDRGNFRSTRKLGRCVEVTALLSTLTTDAARRITGRGHNTSGGRQQ